MTGNRADDPAVARVLGVIDDLERVREVRTVIDRLWECPRCNAPVGCPCVKPSGGLLTARSRSLIGVHEPVHHLPRGDIGARAFNSVHPVAWRQDLLNYGRPPADVLREVRDCMLFKRLVELGKLMPPDDQEPS